jgi:hypothetical protein
MSQISNLPLDTENTGVQEESSISTNATGAFPSKADSHQSAFGPGTEILVMTAAVIGGVSFMGGEGKGWRDNDHSLSSASLGCIITFQSV